MKGPSFTGMPILYQSFAANTSSYNNAFNNFIQVNNAGTFTFFW